MTSAKEYSFDDVLESVGNDGLFQKRFNIIFNLFLVLATTMPYFNLVVALSIPDHWCHVPGRETTNYSTDEWKVLTLPKELDNKGRNTFSRCKMFNISSQEKFEQSYNDNLQTVECQYGWEYDNTWYKKTAVTQEHWVCEKELYVTNTFAFCRLGELFGSFIAGQLGDTIGRKPVFYISLVTLMVGKFASAFTAHIYSVFLTSAVIGSLTNTAVFSSPLIIGMEISKDEERAFIAMLQCVGWTLGMALMPFVMWGVGDWTWFMVLTTLPCLAFLFLNRYLIESPRWLVSRGKVSRSLKELEKIAKVNKTTVPEDAAVTLNIISKKAEKLYGFMSLFSHWRIAKNTSCIIICWVVTALTYFVLVLNTNNLGGNPYLNYFYQGLAELPAYVVGKYACNRVGRKWTHMASYIATSLGCLPLILLINDPKFEWLGVAVAIFLKFSISASFYGVNLHALELYPTCLRQTGMSLGIVSANAFGILGPYIVYLGTSADSRIPYAILALLGIVAACCGLMLPETLHHKLPETLQEAQSFGADQKFFSIAKHEFKPVEVILK